MVYYTIIFLILIFIAIYKFYIEPNLPKEKEQRELSKKREEEYNLIKEYINKKDRPKEIEEIINKRISELEETIKSSYSNNDRNIREESFNTATILLDDNIDIKIKKKKIYYLFEMVHREYSIIGINAVDNVLNSYVMTEMYEENNRFDREKYLEISSIIDNVKEEFIQ